MAEPGASVVAFGLTAADRGSPADSYGDHRTGPGVDRQAEQETVTAGVDVEVERKAG